MSMPADRSAPQPPSGTGVIHDIGYRHYTGARLGRAAIAGSLYLDSLRGAFGLGRSARSKIMPLLLLATVCLPALVIAIIVNVTGGDTLPIPLTSYAVLVSVPVSLYVAGQAPASVSRDLRFRVISLYFSRPLLRSDYVGAKFAAMATAVLALLCVPLLLLYGGALLAGIPAGDTTLELLQAVTGAAVLALMLAGIALLIASVTPRRGLGVAAVIAVLLVLAGVQGAAQGLASADGRQDVATWTTLLSPVSLVDALQGWAFGVDPAGGLAPHGAAGLVFLAVAAAVIAGTYLLMILRYREVSVS
ncbi:MAG: hypothetical protein WAL50_04370 [Kineosporiaceae bacterium]